MKFLVFVLSVLLSSSAFAEFMLIPQSVGSISQTDQAAAVVSGKKPYYPASHALSKACSGMSGTVYAKTVILSFPGKSERDKQLSVYVEDAAISGGHAIEYIETTGYTCTETLSSGEVVTFEVASISPYPKGKRTIKLNGGGWTNTPTGTPGTGTCTLSRGGATVVLTNCDWQ